MSAKAKGSRNELKTRDYYEKRGYRCTKSGGSLGEFDILAVSTTEVLLIQVKSNGWPRPAERQRIEAFPCPPNVRKLMVNWRDYAREPEIREVKTPATVAGSQGENSDRSNEHLIPL